MKKHGLLVLAICTLFACGEKKEEATLSGLYPTDFEASVDGKKTALYTLTNDNGVEACITNYGGRLVSLMVPDKNGTPTDVVLGYGSIADYLASDGNFGALIGRYGNRINNGFFTLDDVTYELPHNNNGHCLHGGEKGYHTKIWDGKQIDNQTLELRYLSPDGEANFPGNLDIKVTYKLTNDNAIDISYEATTDKATIVNLTNHSYFNLSGKLDAPILREVVMINADRYTPVDETLIPTGELAPVENTPMDLRQPIAIGVHIDDEFDQLVKGRGYDHNWVLNSNGDINVVAAKTKNLGTGITMEVYTNEPGVQFYTGNFMTGNDTGKHGITYPFRGAYCLETQHYPDSPNQSDFPSTVLRPGEKYFSRCIYKFGVE
ncbi:aldose epimerase family protein [Parabacteroides sp. PF5-6]|uniref:aldose epimerase family protein n=1 Tax=Parabacteroides sp. PF5-6 TaxID=1742403 RepID=UPI00240677DF|nr:aldose epimerase family protein [Parabacteroides sp. PF5-6]MDF9831791.1 aldose 1-epimerase [Parabacteroides sp. PF5-6]